MSSEKLNRELRYKTILGAIAKIKRYLDGVDEAAFQNYDKKVDAVCMQLIVEATMSTNCVDFSQVRAPLSRGISARLST